jgi:hypothetical protein
MRFDSVKELKGEAFRRLTGVQGTLLKRWLRCFLAKRKERAAGGKPNTLSVEDQLLMRLEYWREYPIFISGKPVGSIKAFRLPGRKAVATSGRPFDVVLIDATETPIERPKNKGATLRARRSGTR